MAKGDAPRWRRRAPNSGRGFSGRRRFTAPIDTTERRRDIREAQGNDDPNDVPTDSEIEAILNRPRP